MFTFHDHLSSLCLQSLYNHLELNVTIALPYSRQTRYYDTVLVWFKDHNPAVCDPCSHLDLFITDHVALMASLRKRERVISLR
jgi:hypothetical protein